MNKKIFLVSILGLILILSSCKKNQKQIYEDNSKQIKENIIEEGKNIEDIDETYELIKNMTIDEKIGQLMIVGIKGMDVDSHTKKMIEDYHIGGFILFEKNILNREQTIKLLNSLKEINYNNPIPLFLSIDEEGGRVSRLSKIFARLPSAKKIGDINDEKISLEYGKILGMRIKSLGFNMNFAPVLDINSNPKNPVIGDRAFGSTIETVLNNGIQVMKGIKSENIVSVVKHFPGHGDTRVDSHINIPLVNKDLEELKNLELIPFTEGIKAGVDSIMISHVLFTQFEKDRPATLSKAIINNLLRRNLNFKGVVISDDMTMGAIVKNYKVENAAIQFLKAGGDIILVCHEYEDQLKVINKIKEDIETRKITEEELDEKVYRIIKLKEKYNIQDNIIEDINLESINTRTKELLNKIK